ncbi:dTDP-4-dehydrorhamnose reductase [Vibrio breoganii]|uniref:dTDP-4-dehydrorhamnose reductase n=1 Tax=Vibrio breoganii TaxID=553239 RepID=UPI00037DBA3A|nr:dTDP-4-dehydrorhamnose reductase [Vibrio breoganii]OED96263.1 dTDP-4-dehydrorhamnose reductase [Vibrio breoganii ZF-29]OEF86001.1 dTDP-4-dehydrorhamnose reductase [Vibrio breoganii 1C10]
MKVLVTGSNGQVGHCLVTQLQGKVDLLAVDRDELDITNQNDVKAVVSQFKPDFIINAAAHTAVDKAEEEEELSFSINRDGPKFLAEAAADVGGTILHISTDYVFPGNKDGLYREDDPTGPLGAYGRSKLAGEQVIVEENDKHIILRTAWVFGEHGNNFVKTMLRLGKDRDVLNIVGDQYGGPSYAGDIANALISIMNQLSKEKDSAKYGVYHFSGQPHVSWYEFANVIFEEAEKNNLLEAPKLASITTDMYPTPAARPSNSKMDCSKIEKVFSIKPSDWQLALQKIKEYTE